MVVNGQVAEYFGTLSPRTIFTGTDGRATAITRRRPRRTERRRSSTDHIQSQHRSERNSQLSTSHDSRNSAGVPITTYTPGAPVAFFTYAPSTGITTATEVFFNAGGSYPVMGSRIMNYAWDWGDGTTDNFNASPSEDHDWAGGGTYPVTLTVTDDLGQRASTTQIITVG